MLLLPLLLLFLLALVGAGKQGDKRGLAGFAAIAFFVVVGVAVSS